MTSVKKITSKATYSVRQEVLRKGKPLETCYFNGDDDATTVHFGLFQDQKLIGVVSIFQFQNPEFSENTQFQIRGMAVISEFQGKGFGEQLLKTAEQYSQADWRSNELHPLKTSVILFPLQNQK